MVVSGVIASVLLIGVLTLVAVIGGIISITERKREKIRAPS